MKKSTPLFRILAVVVLCAVVVYFGVQAYRYFSHPLSTSAVYAAQREDTVVLDGFVVRDEELFRAAGVLHQNLHEGEKVGRGQTIATVYDDASALHTVEQAEGLQLQREQLAFALESYLDGDAALKLDGYINDDLLALHSAIAAGDYSVGSESLSSLKAAILKRDYSYTSRQQLESDLDRVEEQLAQLEHTLAGQVISAPQGGVFSGGCDGYESVLHPDLMETLTPSALRALQPAAIPEDCVGKLIYGDAWYFVAEVTEQERQIIQDRTTLSLRFSTDVGSEMEMDIVHLSPAENGRQLMWLKSEKYLSRITLLRRQNAMVVLSEYEGLHVPSRALHIDGNGQAGVYCVMGVRARFKPVEVLYRGENYALVAPMGDDESRVLRRGDQVISTLTKLSDGQVIG